MVVPVKLGVVKLVPVPKTDPPEEFAYQFSVPELATAPNVTVPLSQRVADVVEVTIGVVLTVAITGVLVEVQLPVEAST